MSFSSVGRLTASTFLCCLVAAGSALGRQSAEPLSRQLDATRAAPSPLHRLTATDIDAERARASAKLAQREPFVIARVDDLALGLDDGRWQDVPGGRLWRTTIASAGATDLSFGFSQFRLPQGASLWIVADDPLLPGYYQGAYTAADNPRSGEFWTPVVPGEQATIELFVPTDARGELALGIGAAARGFQDVFKLRGGPGMRPKDGQGSCNIDVACSQGNPYRDVQRSVVVYSYRESGDMPACTGTLLNDVPRSFRPYVLTASHCGIETPSSVVTYFNYESPSCGALSGGSLNQSVSGATIRAYTNPDIADSGLLELSSKPPASFNVYYAGWDRSGNVPSGTTFGIHHPQAQEKAISFNQDALVVGSNCTSGSTNNNTHWYMDWEQGTTEPGSSGSALFDQNRRVIGYLSGGAAACNNRQGEDCYGRFSFAWTGQPGNQNLAPWLDPNNTGALAVDGADPAITGGGGGLAISGATSGTYIVDGLSSQGFFITIDANPDGSLFFFFAFFTFDNDGFPLWIVGVQNPIPAGSATATMPVQIFQGPLFLDFSGQSAQEFELGAMSFTQTACGVLEVVYDFGANGSGTMTLNQLTGIAGLTCELKAEAKFPSQGRGQGAYKANLLQFTRATHSAPATDRHRFRRG